MRRTSSRKGTRSRIQRDSTCSSIARWTFSRSPTTRNILATRRRESLGEDDSEVESGRPADGRSWLWSPELDMDVVRSAWSEIVASANRHNDPGTFTAFIGYEYSSGGGSGDNLHRNVVFRGDRGPDAPFSSLDSSNPEDLWSAMDRWRAAGLEVLAIPHNMNGSDGRMFEYEYFEGGAIDELYVQQRTLNEPIAEITQIKGTSETHPALSPNDEWADFEVMAFKIGNWRIPSKPAGSYVRDALRRGLAIEAGGAGNPYKLGFIGSSGQSRGWGWIQGGRLHGAVRLAVGNCPAARLGARRRRALAAAPSERRPDD